MYEPDATGGRRTVPFSTCRFTLYADDAVPISFRSPSPLLMNHAGVFTPSTCCTFPENSSGEAVCGTSRMNCAPSCAISLAMEPRNATTSEFVPDTVTVMPAGMFTTSVEAPVGAASPV